MSEVPYFKNDFVGKKLESDFGSGTAGMAVYVGQTLLQYPEKPQLDRLGQTAQVVRQIRLHRDSAALCKSIQIPFRGRRESRFIQKWGVQKMRNCPGFSNRLIQKMNRFRQELIAGLRIREHVQIHLYGRQVLAQTIVKFAGEPSAFLILQLQ